MDDDYVFSRGRQFFCYFCVLLCLGQTGLAGPLSQKDQVASPVCLGQKRAIAGKHVPEGNRNGRDRKPSPHLLHLDFENILLTDAVRLLAKFLNFNVIISPNVQGVASLHIHGTGPLLAFDALLDANGLGKRQRGDIWLVAPRAELIDGQQEETRLRALSQEAAPLITQAWQIKYGHANEIGRLLHDGQASFLSKRGKIRTDERSNVLCVQDDREHVHMVRQLVQQLDVPVKQVLIKARLVSLDQDVERELGLHFGLRPSIFDENKGSLERLGRAYHLAISKIADGPLLDLKLSALEHAGHAELISSPSLFTTDHGTAFIEAGEEIPYQEASESGGTTVAFKKAVLGLKVTPCLLPGDQVLLKLQINQDRPSNRTVLGVPAINTRQVLTSVMLKSGQTVVLGGIYERSKEEGEDRMPILGRIPILSLLFKQKNVHNVKRELLVFVTPKII